MEDMGISEGGGGGNWERGMGLTFICEDSRSRISNSAA